MDTAIATKPEPKTETGNGALPQVNQPRQKTMTVGSRGIRLTTFDEMWRFAVAVHKSGMVTKNHKTPEAILIVLEIGMEVGLPPMQSLKSVALVNGVGSLWGDGFLGVIQDSPNYEWHKEWIDHEELLGTDREDEIIAHCIMKRKGQEPHHVEYSVPRAKRAKLWGKKGNNGQDTPWITDPLRQLQMRARAYCGRDKFSDALAGISMAEEVMDYPVEAYTESIPSSTPAGPKFDQEAIAASNGTTPPPAAPEKTEPIKAEEAEFKDVPAKTESPEVKPEVKKEEPAVTTPVSTTAPKANGLTEKQQQTLDAFDTSSGN